MNDYEVIVVGGGINGCGIARDCSLRGIKTLLLEKHDFAKGASGNNTGMIHGGIRYLFYDIQTTKKSCKDAGYIKRIAPHLLERIPFLLPVMNDDRCGRMLLEGAEIFFEAYDVYRKFKSGKKHTKLTKNQTLKIEPGLSNNIIGAVSLDEWGVCSLRLTLENALDAKAHGAVIKNYSMVNKLIYNHGQIQGVEVFNRLEKKVEKFFAPIVINATGAWGPNVAKSLKKKYQLRYGKGIHLVYNHRISDFGFIMHGVDGQQMFFLPQQGNTVIGTTDDDYYGDLDNLKDTEDEIKYIQEAARRIFPSIDKYRLNHCYWGVRPTIFAWGKNENNLSREHFIIDHKNDGADGLYSVTGGKLATYRILAEEVTDKIAKKLGNNHQCITHQQPLSSYKSSTKIATKKSEKICTCQNITAQEIKTFIEEEKLVSTADLCTRTNLGLGPCAGVKCLFKANKYCGQINNWCAKKQLEQYVQAINSLFKHRKNCLEKSNLAIEELSQYSNYLAANLDSYVDTVDN